MRKVIVRIVFLFSIFSVGLFFGKWLLDIILKSNRDTLKVEAMESLTIGLIVALLIVIGDKLLKKSR